MQRTRLLPLQGGRNFRDLGGYLAHDGRRVRWGRLFRSGVMSYLTDSDHAHLDAIGLRVVCDLRTQREREREPTHWRPQEVAWMQWDYDPGQTSLRSYLDGESEFTPEVTRQCMLRLYRALPSLFAPQYAQLLQRLAAADLPLVFHCSAGKDRTGLAAALVLSALDVPVETIMEDYRLTDELVDLEAALFQHPRSSIGVGDEYSVLSRVDRAARMPLLRAAPEYLETALEQIAREHGSIESYLSGPLGLTTDARDALRAQLLED